MEQLDELREELIDGRSSNFKYVVELGNSTISFGFDPKSFFEREKYRVRRVNMIVEEYAMRCRNKWDDRQ